MDGSPARKLTPRKQRLSMGWGSESPLKAKNDAQVPIHIAQPKKRKKEIGKRRKKKRREWKLAMGCARKPVAV